MESSLNEDGKAYVWTIHYILNGIEFDTYVWTIKGEATSLFNRWDYCWVRDNYVQKSLENTYNLSLKNYKGKYNLEQPFTLNISEYDTFCIHSDDIQVVTDIMYDIIDKCLKLDLELSNSNFVFGIYSENGQKIAHIYYEDLQKMIDKWGSVNKDELQVFINEEINFYLN